MQGGAETMKGGAGTMKGGAGTMKGGAGTMKGGAGTMKGGAGTMKGGAGTTINVMKQLSTSSRSPLEYAHAMAGPLPPDTAHSPQPCPRRSSRFLRRWHQCVLRGECWAYGLALHTKRKHVLGIRRKYMLAGG